MFMGFGSSSAFQIFLPKSVEHLLEQLSYTNTRSVTNGLQYIPYTDPPFMSWKTYEDTSTSELIEYIKWKGQPEYLEAATEAYTALYFRFCEDLIQKCRIVVGRWGYDKVVCDEIAERTFKRFWSHPHTFDEANCKTYDINTCLKLYLYRVAQNQLSDYRKQEARPNPYTGKEEIVKDFPDLENLNTGEAKRKELKRIQEIITKALDRLSPKHKIIYLTYKAHSVDGFNLPDSLTKSMQDELDLTQISIRVYKKQAIDKVNEYLDIYGNK
jgi:RNA polymerase sigma factor (sigma-70 family)